MPQPVMPTAMPKMETIEGFGERGPLSPGAPAGPIEGAPAGQITIEPYTEPTAAPAAQAGPPNLYQQANQFLGQLREQATSGISKVLSGGRPEMQLAGKTLAPFINPVPGSVPQAGMMALNPVIGMARGGPAVKAAAMSAWDALMGGMEGGPLGAVMGGVGGALGGLGAGAATQFGKGSKGFQAVQKTKEFGKQIASKEVKTFLQDMSAKDLTREQSLRGLQEAASKGVQTVVDTIGKALPKNLTIPVQGLDPVIGATYGLNMIQRPMGGSLATGTFAELDSARRALRAANDPQWRAVERAMIQAADQHVTTMEGPAGKAYKAALTQYRADQRLIDVVEGIQGVRAKGMFGGVNPTDFPQAEQISKLGMGTGTQPGVGAVELGLGAAHPTSGFGGYHAAKGISRIFGTGKPPITGPLTPPSALRKAGAKAGAVAASEAPAIPRRGKGEED